ncbi:hypothetical protein [Nostoc sp.]|uniref:hypothetical protein n=1 Tax=Nostoc sp. TaxID=1180 RepID=UPI002FFAB62B
MVRKDPEITKRNKEIAALTEQIRELESIVLKYTGCSSLHSLNGKYGGKYAEYIDIKNEVIDTPEQFISLYCQGFHKKLESLKESAQSGNYYFDAWLHFYEYEEVREWLKLFLKRTFLRNYKFLSKVRPTVEESVMWIGQENASYGLLVTPRFGDAQWENDQSEIRHFKPRYWTILHILKTGLVIPFEKEKIVFHDIEQYLTFFKNTLVRNSGSIHEKEIAKRYCDFVRNADEPENVPLLIPELRYGGISKKHEYRLDFTIVNPFNLSKVGFELSPWSTHGELTGIKGKTQKAINEEVKANFEKEMMKIKSYFRKLGITVIVYTDSDLEKYDVIFEEISKYLSPSQSHKQLEFQAIADLLAFKPNLTESDNL